MGRRERPLDPAAGPAERFAHGLRILRQEAGGITYRAMAAQVHYSAAALAQAATGDRLPTLPVALAYVEACGGDRQEWTGRWQDASREVAELTAQQVDPGDAPYLGLARFEPGDRERFFGRQRLVERLVDVVRERPLTALVGPSGVGKSSLLRAGLVPALREVQGAHRPTAIRILTPGPHPARTHAGLLAPQGAGRGVVVVVDQFEEAFTLCTDAAERNRFLDLLLAATAPERGGRLVLAVRADFFGHCAAHRPLAEAVRDATHLVTPMSREELREVVVRPAAAHGLTVERSLTARILAEAADEPGSLPLVSHALLETWRRRHGRLLDEAAYDAAGGIRGAIARTAEDLWSGFTPEQAATARAVLLRLVTPGRGTEDVRRPADRAEFDHRTAPVLERLARARLITLTESTVDLAHEALLTAWPRLRTWIDEDRDRIQQHRRLTEAALTWQALGRDADSLYRGVRLSAAQECFPSEDRGELTELEREFLERSAADRGRGLRRRSLTTLGTVVLVLAMTAGLLAWQQGRTNERRRIEAEAGRIARVAAGLRSSDPVTAMRLSLAAWRLADGPETRSAVLAAMVQPELDVFTDPQGTPGTVRRLSMDGRSLLSIGFDEVVRWSLDTHLPTSLGWGFGAETKSVGVVRADGNAVPLFAADGSVQLRTLSGIDRNITGTPARDGAEFGPDGRLYVVYDHMADRYVARIRDLGTRPDLELTSPRDPRTPDSADTRWVRRSVGWSRPREHRAADMRFPDVIISPDSRLAALCAPDAPLQLWNLVDNRRIDTPWTPVGTVEQCFEERYSFSPGGRLLALTAEKSVRLWDVATGRELEPIDVPGVQEIAFSADGTLLATASPGRIGLWRVNTAVGIFGYDTSEEDVTDLRIDQEAGRLRYLSTATDSQRASVHTLDIRPALAVEEQPETAVSGFSPDGTLLAAARWLPEDSAVRWQIRDGRSGTPLYELPPESCRVQCDPFLAFSPDGGYLVRGVRPGESETETRPRIDLWDTVQRKTTVSLDPPAAGSSAAVGPGGTWVVLTDSPNGSSQFWNLRYGTSVTFTLDGVAGAPVARPDGRMLVTSQGNVVGLPAGGSASEALGPGKTATLAFNIDGTALAAADASGRIVLWDGSLTRRLGTLVPPLGTRHITALAFSHDGQTLAEAALEGDIQLWDLTTNRPLGPPLPTSGDPIHALSFALDDTTLYASGQHIPFQRFDIAPPTAAARTCARAGGGLTAEQWRRFLPGIPYRKTCP
ncbi:nSTAND1 domain-containing NTPase [Kitasatospora griseola]